MFDNDASSRPRLARAATWAVAAVAGVLLGAVLFWSVQFNEVGLAINMIVVGLAVGFLKPPWPLVVIAAAAMLGTMTVLGHQSWSNALAGFFFGIVYAFGFLVVILIMTAVRARRSFLQRGWDLAFAEAREHDARVERAVALEREAMAGEMHDGLGHRLTLIAVQAARLSLDEELPPRARAEMESIRANAAAAADELGETVGLLTGRTSAVTASLSGLGIEDVIERARASGVSVRSTIAPAVESAANDYTRAALLRALQEGLTNAAKHAPDAEVRIAVDAVGDEVVLEMRNAAASPRPAAGPSGHGLVALRHRAAILGGSLEAEDGEDFTLILRLPCSSMPSPTATRPQPSRIDVLVEEAAGAKRHGHLATRLAWMVPAAGLVVSALVVAGYFVYHNVGSTLPAESFAAIEVGDTREATERVLPAVDMLDEPDAVLPEPPGATCNYYEASVSFFERVDVYRVCFADDRVVSTDTIPPS
ncbi:sensor histidine kinase [Glycomyces buryatensis]|uniref:histidine kinase n=1 Tax=Glycomyces buryatensis TaxID=2570927 RepID=A0A4S8PZ20_9ACTN|nr:histidine kinase [Glycomyces buryatensis]THV33499.1 two-component sensor histidine kinase [Glycomyces buryatensis]